MGADVARYLVPVVALLVTFLAGGALFFVIVAVNPSEDDSSAALPLATPAVTGTPVTTTPAAGTSTESPAPSPTAGPAQTPAATPPAPPASIPSAPSVTAVPTQSPPPAIETADFAGSWQLIDTVEEGPGAGETYAFFVTIVQSGSGLQGGAPGVISLSGTVVGNVATAEFAQPALGVTGIFIWTMGADGNAAGTFTSSIPNSGTSQLIRVQ